MEDNDLSKPSVKMIQTNKPLFPCAGETDTYERSGKSLFPAAKSAVNEDEEGNTQLKDLDWLQNKSYTEQTAIQLVKFQKELSRLQKDGSTENEGTSKANENRAADGTKYKGRDTAGRDTAGRNTAGRVTGDTVTHSSGSSEESGVHSSRRKDRDRRIDRSSDDSGGESYREYDRDSRTSHSKHRGQGDYDDGSKRRHAKKRKKNVHDSNDGSEDEYRKKKKKKDKHHPKHKKHKKEKVIEDNKLDIKKEMATPFSSNKIFLDDMADLAPEHAYRLDRVSDRNSWLYGSLYSQHVARYHPLCYRCLGTSHGQEVSIGHTKKHGKPAKNDNERYFGKENRKLVLENPAELVPTGSKVDINSQGNHTFGEDLLYIKIETDTVERQRHDADIREKILDPSTSLYVQGRGVKKERIDDKQELVNPTRDRIAEFNRKVRETPKDIELWLNFVKFQDSLYVNGTGPSGGGQAVGEIGKPNARAVLDKKLSIIDKALEANAGNIDLILAKMDLQSEMVEATTVNKELENLLFVQPANVKLWRYYLTLNQSRLSLFNVSKVTKRYHRCFKTLFGIYEGRVHAHSVSASLGQEIMDIFLQYCQFLKQAGHRERALASLQALLEYSLFSPPQLESAARETKMAALEEFWDSGCARVGQAGALGWRTWKESTDAGQAVGTVVNAESTEDQEEEIVKKNLPKHATWLEIELLRERNHWLPWQPDVSEGQTEEDCEDVERVVLFDDVSPVVYQVSSDNRLRLVTSFLSLLGYGHILQECRRYYLLQPCSSADWFVEELKDVTTSVFVGSENDSICDSYDESAQSLVENLLNQVLPMFTAQEKTFLTLVLIQVQLRKFHKTSVVQTKSDKKEMRKILKTVLKEENNRDNLLIWAAYIDLERVIGKRGEAEAISETALCMHSGIQVDGANVNQANVNQANVNQANGLVLLYGQYGEMLLGIKNGDPIKMLERSPSASTEVKQKVCSVLNCLVEGAKFNPKKLENLSSSGVLKTLTKFTKLIESICTQLGSSCDNSESVCEMLISLCWCHGLFVYCTSGIDACLAAYVRTMSVISNLSDKSFHSTIDQCLYRSQLRMILYHMSTMATPLHMLRQCLDAALVRYPNSAVFLGLFVDVEKRSRVTGRLNRHFDRWSRSSASLVPVVFAACVQIQFLTEMSPLSATGADDPSTSCSGIVHRTRVWLEHTLSHSSLQHYPLLWKLYLQLEKRTGGESRLKGVFYRAIQQCPWVKSLYLDGVKLFGDAELQAMADLMMEKELRVHLPVEELDILIG